MDPLANSVGKCLLRPTKDTQSGLMTASSNLQKTIPYAVTAICERPEPLVYFGTQNLELLEVKTVTHVG